MSTLPGKTPPVPRRRGDDDTCLKSTTSTTSQRDNENEFLAHWKRLQQDFVSRPLGSMNASHWNQGEALLKDLRVHTNKGILKPQDRVQAVHNGFAIVDRMVAEVQHSTSTTTTTTQPPIQLPLEYETLAAVLLIWRDAMRTTNRPSSSRRSPPLQPPSWTPPPTNDTQSHSNSQQQQPPQPETDVFSVPVVWQKLQTYHHHNLFEFTVAANNVLLHVLTRQLQQDQEDDAATPTPAATTTHGRSRMNPTTVLEWAKQTLVPSMLERSQHNPVQTRFHPDTQTLYFLVELCILTHNPQAHVQADAYLQQLQDCQKQQQDGSNDHVSSKYEPSTYFYCAVMEAHSKYNPHPTAALERIWHLFEQMTGANPRHADESVPPPRADTFVLQEQQLALEQLDDIAMSRTCIALANVKHPQHKNIQAARFILDAHCQAVLKRHQDKDHSSYSRTTMSGTTPPPKQVSTRMFVAVLAAYSRAGMATQAQHLLDYMEQLATTLGDPHLRPDMACYSSLLWAHAKVGNTEESQAVFQRMIQAMEEGGSLLVDSWHPQAWSRVWNGILMSWVDSKDSIDVMKSILERMEQYNNNSTQQSGRPRLFFTVHTYNLLLTAYARPTQPNPQKAAVEAEQLLEWMETQPQHDGAATIFPDGSSYFNVIRAWANAGEPERCEFHIRKLYENIVQGKIDTTALQAQHFNVVIEAWAKSSHRSSTSTATIPRIQSVLQRMRQMGVAPDAFTYTSYLWALVNSIREKNRHSQKHYRNQKEVEAKLVLEVFQDMKDQWEKGNSSVKPSVVTFSAVLTALSLSEDSAAVEKVKQLMEDMREMELSLTIDVTITCMTAFMKHFRAERAEELYQHVQEMYKAGDSSMKPTEFLHRTRLHSWCKVGNPEQAAAALWEWIQGADDDMTKPPSTVDFTSVLVAWIKSGRPEGLEKAERGLDRMMELSKNGTYDCYPNAGTFRTILSAYAKSNLPNCGEKAAAVFERLKRLEVEQPHDNDTLKPSLTMYNMVMQAWVKEHQPHKAEQVFQQAKEDLGLGESGVHWTRVQAWVQAGNPEMATRALHEWMTEEEAQKPSTRQFNAVLSCWAQSRHLDATRRAHQIFQGMYQLASPTNRKNLTPKTCESGPDMVSYETLIVMYSRTNSPDSASQALSLLNSMKQQALTWKQTNNQLDQSNLTCYVETIVAIAQSNDPKLEQSARSLLEELRKKPASFWVSNKNHNGTALHRIKTALSDCSYPSKVQMMVELYKLNRTVEAATRNIRSN